MTKYFTYALFFLSLLLMLALSHYFFWQIGDDSYIYFRYVDKALAGHWWRWSEHIAPVEGYSSPLWYLLLIALGKLGMGVELASRALGLFFACCTLLITWLLARQLRLSPVYIALAGLLLVLNKGFHFWASSGLETALYSALYSWAALAILNKKYWPIPLALIGIARPEGPFLLIALCLALLIFRRGYLNARNLALIVLPTLAWQAVRWLVYDDVLPNTFYAKATGHLSDQLGAGLFYCLPFLLPLLLAWCFWFGKKDDKQKADLLVLLGMCSLLLGIVLLGGGDWMFFWRLLVPVLALLWIVQWHYFAQALLWQKSLLLIFNSLLLLGSVPASQVLAALQGQTLPIAQYQEGFLTPQSIALAKTIRQHYGDKQLIAVNHAGALPWALPESNVIDMVGLNDKHIAHVEGDLHKKYDAQYVLSLKPDLIVLNSRTKPGTDGFWYHPGYWVGETALVNLPEFQQHYQKTDFIKAWQWQIPWPYSAIYHQQQVSSWILLYQRKPAMPE